MRGPISLGCLLLGCDRFRFQNFSGVFKTYNVSTCVSERTGPQAYTDAAPSLIALVGPNYPPPADALPVEFDHTADQQQNVSEKSN